MATCSACAMVDLTVLDGDENHEMAKLWIPASEVQQSPRNALLATPPCTPTKRKANDDLLQTRQNLQTCNPCVIDITDDLGPAQLNNAPLPTPSSKASMNFSTPILIQSKRAKRVRYTPSLTKNSVNNERESVSKSPHIKEREIDVVPSAQVGGGEGSSERPVDISLDDSEDAIAVIDRTFPVANSGATIRRASRLELLAHPIQIIDEDEDGHPGPTTSNVDPERRTSGSLISDDSLTDSNLRRWLKIVQLEGEDRTETQTNQRTELDTFRTGTFTCAPGKGVALEDGSFLRIKRVSKDGKGQVFVAGLHLVRGNFLGLKLPKRRSEVLWIQEAATRKKRQASELYEVPVSQVQKNREIIFTNQQFPLVSSRTDKDSLWDPIQDVELGPLFCRWKMTESSKGKDLTAEGSIEHLTHRDADDKIRQTKLGGEAYTRIVDTQSRFNWRQITTIPGGSHVSTQHLQNLEGGVEVTESRAYTFGDAFCGAGRASRGAVGAGLAIKWGFDMDEQAIGSYNLNFAHGGTDCRHQAVHEFLESIQANPPVVDVLHISPPCQPFSHAHTVPSPQRDEVNQAALFSVWHLVETLKPRVATIEETDALMSRHHEWFSALVNILVNLGYSVRWAALQCGNYGVPQTRKRLFLVAAGPGDKLPAFPPPTHSKDDPSLKRLVTINDMILTIPRNATDHDKSCYFPHPKPPYSGATQAKTLTCKGGDTVGNYHPSGLRRYTIRELARMQTFPLYHSFGGARGITARKVQNGNAVPPVLARAVFKSVVRSLRETDGVV